MLSKREGDIIRQGIENGKPINQPAVDDVGILPVERLTGQGKETGLFLLSANG